MPFCIVERCLCSKYKGLILRLLCWVIRCLWGEFKDLILMQFCQVERCLWATLYPITPHVSTCAYSMDNWNFEIFHREKATDISTCAYVLPSSKKRMLETCYRRISRPNKTKVCKLNLSYLYDFSKYCLEFGI